MSKQKKKVLKLSSKDITDVLNTLSAQFKVMTSDEKKAVLKKIGVSKTDIEQLDDTGLINKLRSEYNKILPKIDLNDFKVDQKYIKANEFITKNDTSTKTLLKKEIEDYKKI